MFLQREEKRGRDLRREIWVEDFAGVVAAEGAGGGRGVEGVRGWSRRRVARGRGGWRGTVGRGEVRILG